MHKVTRGLRERSHILSTAPQGDFHQILCAPRNMNSENGKSMCFTEVSGTFLLKSTKYCACYENMKNKPEASEVLHLSACHTESSSSSPSSSSSHSVTLRSVSIGVMFKQSPKKWRKSRSKLNPLQTQVNPTTTPTNPAVSVGKLMPKSEK